jgi:hypothetical protein
MGSLRDFMGDERGASSMVIKLVLAVTLGAAVIVIMLQLMHVNLETASNSSSTMKSGAKKAMDGTMKTISD